jgi:uncharacterized protein (DUF885 family)
MFFRSSLTTLLVVLLFGFTAHAANVSPPSARLKQIGDRYFEDGLRLDPMMGSFWLGEDRFNGRLEVTISPSNIAKEKAMLNRVLSEISELPSHRLNAADQLSLAVLRDQVQGRLDGHAFPSHWLPLDQYGSLPVTLAQFATGQSAQPLKTVKNYEDFLKRLERLPAWNSQAIYNIRQGMKNGVILPKPLIERALETLQPLTVADPEAHPYFLPIKTFPKTFTWAQRQRLEAMYRSAIAKRIQPSLKGFVEFINTDYLPHGRATDGFDALPNGKAWYARSVRFHTTTDQTPEAIHSLGLSEVSRVRGEIAKIQSGYGVDGSIAQFLERHQTLVEFRPFKKEQEVLDAYAELNRKVQSELPKLFKKSPKAALAILPEPELTKATASAHYDSPAPDGSRPGVFFAVIMRPDEYTTTEMTSLFLHEGQPGHHFHLAGQQELSLPNFRKYAWITAYGEGWALYAETLGHEMGLYKDPNALLGHLILELRRAVRLVTDTGLHSKGWSREQTMQYMMDMEGISALEARRATERYMADPGQALAYKIGALKIRELRDRAQEALGAKFSLAEFHDQVLSDGALPLPLLERKIDLWIRQAGK